MKLALPPGFEITERILDGCGVITIRCPSDVRGNMKRNGEFVVIGCRTDAQLDQCLRLMLPAYGVPYPHDPQLTLL